MNFNSSLHTLRNSLLFIALAVIGSTHAQEDPAKMVSAKDIQKALVALEGFVLADNWEMASRFVLDADHLKDRMAKHYAKYPWKKINILGIPNESANRFDGTVVYKVVFFDLVVEGYDRVIPVSLTEVDGDFKVDWEPLVQKLDFTFEKFLEDKPSGPEVFMLALQRGVPLSDETNLGLPGGTLKLRAKYRNFDVDIDGLRVDFIENVYLGEDTPLGKEIKEAQLVPWTAFDGPFRITLQWNKSGAKPFIEVKDLYKVDLMTPSMFPQDTGI